jgi:Tol biopolymer transport system component
MTLAAGTRLGPYEIQTPLGAGGMGEVYRAKDTRLDRSVAIKVLPKELSQDAELKARLTREARAISALNHPHICALYDVGSEDGLDYLVMELLEGESLADRLAKGPLPTDQVLRFGFEIAEALDRAHRQGIVHRDLKPGNVMLTKSGVKLLDFGLAKLREKEAEPALSNLPTRLASKPLTERGTVLGTFQYMSPEQLEGKDVDARADIFALGALLYEMSTGRKAFSGTSQASLIAAILSSEPPPISTIQKMSPPALDRLVKTCLAKDPEERWQSAHDVAAELRWIAEGGSQVGAPAVVVSKRKNRERLAWALAVLLTGALALSVLRLGHPDRELVRLSLPAPKPPYVYFDCLAPSPEGRRIAYVAYGSPEKRVLAVRDLGAEDAQVVAGTEGGWSPFWSPDGRSLGFFADGKLKRVDVAGGPPRVLADAPQPYGGSWGKEGVILFAFDPLGVLQRIPAEGGTPQPAAKLYPGEEGDHWPSFLPDGKRFVFLADAPSTAAHSIRIGALDSLESTKIVQAVSNALFAPPDRILFVRAGTLLAQRFDSRTGRTLGEPAALGAPIAVIGDNHRHDFGLNGDVLAFQTRSREKRLTWVDRTGKRLEAVGEPELYDDFRISPDGGRVVFSRLDPDGRPENLWVLDLARGTVTRLTSAKDGDFTPVWSPQGDRIYFTSLRNGKQGDIYVTPAGGGGPDELVSGSADQKVVAGITRDGSTLLVERATPATMTDILLLSIADKKMTPVAASPFDERSAALSPEDRFVAYASNESGRFEIYVKQIGSGARVQVSSGGGQRPRWRADGKELFFIAPTGTIMSAATTLGPPFAADTPRALFGLTSFGDYDVSESGQRLLVSLRADESIAPKTSVLLGWTKLLGR